MAANGRDKAIFHALFLGLIALHLVLVLSARLYPFTDIPDHLAAATIARHAGEPTNQFSEYYRVDTFMKPNTAHLIFTSAKMFPSVELANRIFFALYAILLPLSVLLAIRKLGGNRWFALLSFLFMYNYNVSWGFAGYALAIPLVLLFCRFYAFDERAFAGAARILGAAVLLAVLYFVHLLAAIFCLLLLALKAVLGRKGPARELGGVVLGSLPLVILIAAWWRAETRGYAGMGTWRFLAAYYGSVFIRTLGDRAQLFTLDNYHLFAGARGYAVAALFSLGAVMPAAVLSLRRARTASGGSSAVIPLLIGALLCFALLPNEIPQQAVLYERFSVFVLLALIIYGGARAPASLPRGVAVAFAALAVIHFALWANYFFDFNRENAGFDAAFLRPAHGGEKLAGLIYDYRYRGRPVYIHFPSYYIVWEKGIATASITSYRFGPIRRRVSALRLPRYLEWIGKRGSYDGRYRDMDYLLVRGHPPGMRETAGGPAAPSHEAVPTAAARFPAGFEVARTSGTWILYETSGERR
jgi:hypothetical protein